MNKRVSLKDVAQKVGVSTALVSYVLNNQKEDRIGKAVAQKIRDAAREMNYRTNQIAKSLKTNKSYTLGLIVADISNPFSSTLARIIEDEADNNNYTVIFGSSDENLQKSSKLIDTFLNRQIDGVLFSPSENSEAQINYLQEQNVPFVLVDRYFPSLDTNYVAIDNYKASYSAIKHMIASGYKKIGFIHFESSLFHLTERKRGYEAALKDNALNYTRSLSRAVSYVNTKHQVEKAIEELLSPGNSVDGIFFVSNTVATFGLKYINTLKIKVPQELGLASFDETEALDLFYSPLTFIKQPLLEMGQAATQILLDCISDNTKTTQLNLEAKLVIRESTAGPSMVRNQTKDNG